MALPKIKHTAYQHHLTGLDKTVQFRCFTNAEQKSLLEAKEEQDQQMIVQNIKNVVQACILDDINVDDLTLYDFEDIFMRIRAKSVDQFIQGNIQVPYMIKAGEKTGQEAKHQHQFKIDTKDIKVVHPDEAPSPNIRVTENYTLKMTHPTVASSIKDYKDQDEFLIEHMVCVFSDDGDDVTYIKDEKPEDVRAFYDSIETPVLLEIMEFMNNQPHLYYALDVEDPNGDTHKIEFKSLEDFFT